MGYLGLVPGERSTGETIRRLGITKAGNGRVSRALIESAWSYRHLPRTSKLNIRAFGQDHADSGAVFA
jgi:transposase